MEKDTGKGGEGGQPTRSKGSHALGAAMYAMGIVLVSSIVEPLSRTGLFHPAMELALIALGVFILSALYYGNYSYVLMLVCGMYFGSSLATAPFYSVFAVIPLLHAMSGGARMGDAAFMDFKGKQNFFEKRQEHIISAAKAVVMAAAVGYFLGYATLADVAPLLGVDTTFIDDFIRNLAIQ